MTPLFRPGRAPSCKPSAHSGNPKVSREVTVAAHVGEACALCSAAGGCVWWPAACRPRRLSSLHPEPRRAKLPGPLGCKEQHLAQNAEGERQPHAGHRRRVFSAKTGGAWCLLSSDSPRPSIRLIHALDYSKALKLRPSLSMIHIDAHPLRNFQSTGVYASTPDPGTCV